VYKIRKPSPSGPFLGLVALFGSHHRPNATQIH
jgi:hypothetical protein